jgi:hypothetical protein
MFSRSLSSQAHDTRRFIDETQQEASKPRSVHSMFGERLRLEDGAPFKSFCSLHAGSVYIARDLIYYDHQRSWRRTRVGVKREREDQFIMNLRASERA